MSSSAPVIVALDFDNQRAALDLAEQLDLPLSDVAARVEGVSPEELTALAGPWEGQSKGDLKRAGLTLVRFRPELTEVFGAVLLFLLGFAATRRLGRGSRAAAA